MSPSLAVKSYDKIGIKSGVVLDLPGFEGAGSLIRDASMYHNNGTITGASWSQLASGLQVLDFDGTDDNIIVPDNVAFDVTTLSVELWFKPSRLFKGDLCMKGTGTLNLDWFLFQDDSGDGVWFSCGSWGGDNFAKHDDFLVIDTWYHIVGVYDGTNVKLYTNGIWRDDANAPLAPVLTASDVYIGERYSGTYDFQGSIALVRIYNRVLSALEIQSNFNRERHLFGV